MYGGREALIDDEVESDVVVGSKDEDDGREDQELPLPPLLLPLLLLSGVNTYTRVEGLLLRETE